MSTAMRRAAAGCACRTHLQHPEGAVLDGELDVAHVGVVVLEDVGVAPEFGGDGRGALVEHGDRLGLVRAGDDVLALGTEHDVAERPSAHRSTGRG